MKIGLLGGSFNPPHLGHIHISNLAIKYLNLDEVWWIPTAKNPLKDPNIYENYENRVEKCRIITKNYDKIKIQVDDEIYSEKLVRKLRDNFKNEDFYWIMGADNFERLHEWENFIEMIKMVPFGVFARENYLEKIENSEAFKIIKKQNLINRLLIFASEKLDISSTQIRNNA